MSKLSCGGHVWQPMHIVAGCQGDGQDGPNQERAQDSSVSLAPLRRGLSEMQNDTGGIVQNTSFAIDQRCSLNTF